MRSRLRAGKHSKAGESGKLSDAQLLEKFGIKRCYVKLNRLKSDDYELSDVDSSLKNPDNKPIDESKHQMSESRHREERKRRHFDSGVIRNVSQNLHDETLEKCTDHRHLREINEKAINLPTKDKDRRLSHSSLHLDSAGNIFENREEMNSTETCLAWKRSNRSSSNLDDEISEAKFTSLEEARGIKLPEEEKRKTDRSVNSNLSREALNSGYKCSEIILGDHKEEGKIGLKQTRKKDRTSTDSKRTMQDFGSECLGMVLSSPDQVEESVLLQSNLSKNNRTRGSSNSGKETQHFNFKHSENIIVDPKQAMGGNQAEIEKRKQQKNRSFFSSNRDVENVDVKCTETVIATQENRGRGNRIQIQSRNKSPSNSSGEVQNPDYEDSEMVLSSHEQEKECSPTEIDLSIKDIKSSIFTSRGKQNLDFLCSKELHAGSGHFETVNKSNSRKIGWMKTNRSFPNSNRISQNLDSGSSEAALGSFEQMQQCNLPETDLSRRNKTRSSFNSNNRTQDFNSECLKVARHEQEEPTVIDLSIKKRTRSSSACVVSQDFNPGCSEIRLFGLESKDENNLKEIDLSIKNRTRSSSTSDIRAQDLSSEYSKRLLPRKPYDTNLKEIDLSIKNRVRNSSTSTKFQGFNSEDSGALLSGRERAVEIDLKEIDLSRKGRARSTSNSCLGTQNLEYLYCQEVPYDHKAINQIAVSEKKNSCTFDSIRRNPSFTLESSETAPSNHEQIEGINQMQTRSRRSSRNPSEFHRETQNLDSKCYETVFVRELESSLTGIGLLKNRNKSPTFSNSEPLKSDQMEKIYQTPATVSWRNRPRSSSNSSEETESLNSEFSEDIPFNSKQIELNSRTEIGLPGKKRSSDSNREIRKLDSEFSGKRSDHTKEKSVVLSDQLNLPTIKRTRYSPSSSNSFLETRSSQLEKKNEEHQVQIQKEKKDCINSAHGPNAEEENSVLSTSRTTRNSSSFSRNRHFISVLTEKHTGHLQTQNIDLKHKSNLLPKKRSQSFVNSNNEMQVLHSEHSYLDCNLPAKKRARNSFSLSSTPQTSDSESSKKHNEHLLTQKMSLDSNLSSETEYKSPAVLNSEARNPDFSKKQNELVQSTESNQPKEDPCLNKNKTASDLDCKTKKSTFKFSRENPDDLKEQEVPDILSVPDSQQEAAENTIASDLPESEKIETHSSPSKKENASDFENSYVKDYHANDELQILSPASFNLNNKCEDSISENIEKKDPETELERSINLTDEEEVSLQQSISQTEASSCLDNKHNLSDTEILKSSDIEKSMNVPGDVSERQEKYSTANDVQGIDTEGGNSESELTDMDDAEKNVENQDKSVEVLESLTDCKKILQDKACTSSNSEDFDPNVKHLKPDGDVEKGEDDVEERDDDVEEGGNDVGDDGDGCGGGGTDWKEENNDLEEAEIYEEESLDAILKKKYGIKDCKVVLERHKPFSVHYGVSFLKEIAQKGYSSSLGTDNIDLERLYRRESFSQFSSLSQETFEHEIRKYIERFYLCDDFIRRRRELIKKNEAKLLAIKKSMKRKVFYDGNDFVFIKDERVQEVRAALRNKKYPLVKLKKNEEAEYLARKLVKAETIDIELDEIDDETSDQQQPDISTDQQPDDGECDQYLEVCESGDELDQSSNNETNTSSKETQDPKTSLHLESPTDSLQVDEKLQNSNLDGERVLIGKQPFICDNHQHFGTMQNHSNQAICITFKPKKNLQRLQNQNRLAWNPTLASEQQFHRTLHSEKFKKAVADSYWPRVLLHPLGKTIEKECTKSLPTAVGERLCVSLQQTSERYGAPLEQTSERHCDPLEQTSERHIPLQQTSERHCVPSQKTDDGEQTDTTIVPKKIEYDESPESSSPSPGSGTSLSTEHSDDDSENKSSSAANDEFFVIDEDDDDSDVDAYDSERCSSCSDSEYYSESDQQQSGTESQESHQNSDSNRL